LGHGGSISKKVKLSPLRRLENAPNHRFILLVSRAEARSAGGLRGGRRGGRDLVVDRQIGAA